MHMQSKCLGTTRPTRELQNTTPQRAHTAMTAARVVAAWLSGSTRAFSSSSVYVIRCNNKQQCE
jgi:hypothetical protein